MARGWMCWLAVVLLTGFCGCDGEPKVAPNPAVVSPQAEHQSPEQTAEAVSVTAEATPDSAPTIPQIASDKPAPTKDLQWRIRFKAASGDRLYELKPKSDGAKLVDGHEKELVRFNLSDRKLKVKTSTDEVLGYVIAKDAEFKITNADQSHELFELQKQADGDWKLKSGADQLLAVIKVRDYGFEIEDGAEKSLFKIKRKDGKTSLRDSQDKTVLSTQDPVQSLAVACLGLDQLEPFELRAALMACIELMSRQ